MPPKPEMITADLVEKIKESGPISVMEYMRAANTAYYAQSNPFGVLGDFITAPEISQIFGEMIGLWLTDLWMRAGQPANCHYVELGPGRGSLAADALRVMGRFKCTPDVHFVETSHSLREKQRAAIPGAQFHDGVGNLPGDGPLFIIANEFFDALPIRQFMATGAGWRELMVMADDDDRFIPIAGSVPVDHLVPVHLRGAAPDAIYETAPDIADIAGQLSGRVKRQGGVFLTIDYGHMAPATGNTLQAVKDHQYADPYCKPGLHDLTAHVDFSEIANIGYLNELHVGGPVTQGAWLMALGIAQRAQNLAAAVPDRAEEIFAACNRLVDGEHMGQLFKILALTAPEWPVAEGFRASPL